jgi:SAM-dependent methyltransferase
MRGDRASCDILRAACIYQSGAIMESGASGTARRAMTVDLIDLGDSAPHYKGIFIPRQDVAEAKVGITEQFLANAGTYHERYSAVERFQRLIKRATEGRFARPPRMILDIGSGSGNSVFPCLQLFPDAEIVATDLSEDLLAILRDHVESRGDSGRLSLICVDATKPYFARSFADLVIGAAILHHLIDPAACIRSSLPSVGRQVDVYPFLFRVGDS